MNVPIHDLPRHKRPLRVTPAAKPYQPKGLHRQMLIKVMPLKRPGGLSKNIPPRVLVVDDDSSIVETMCRALEALGYEAKGCLNPVEALSQLESNKFDVVLTDYRMPEMNGVEFTRLAKKRNVNLPFVLVTAYVSTVQLEDSHQAGINTILNKPWDLAELDQALKDVTRAL